MDQDRNHRPLQTHASGKTLQVPRTIHSIEMEVKTVNTDHVILTSPETGEIRWPLSKLSDHHRENLAPGDRLPLSAKTVDEMHQLLEDLVGH